MTALRPASDRTLTNRRSRQLPIQNRLHFGVLVVLLLAGALLRLSYLDQPLRFDEASTFNRFASVSFEAIVQNSTVPNNQPLFTALMRLSAATLGESPLALRFAAFASGLLLLATLYSVAWHIYDRQTALIALALAVGSLPLVAFSANGQGYGLMAWVTIALTGLADIIVHRRRGGTASRRLALVSYGVLLLLLFWIDAALALYPAGIVTSWLVLLVLAQPRGSARTIQLRDIGFMLLLSSGAMLLSYRLLVGIWPPVVAVWSGSRLSAETLYRDLLALPDAVMAYLHRGLPVPLPQVILFGAGVGALMQERMSPRLYGPLIPAVLMLVPLTILTGDIAPPDRHWLFLLPPYLMLAAAGLRTILLWLWPEDRASQALWYSGWALLIALAVCLPVVLNHRVPRDEETGRVPQAVQAADLLAQRLNPGDVVLLTEPYTEVMRYYLTQRGVSGTAVVDATDGTFRFEPGSRAVYAMNPDRRDALRAQDFPPLVASNLTLTSTQLVDLGRDVVEQITVSPIAETASRVRPALFADDFEGATLDDWVVDAYRAEIVTTAAGDNRMLEVEGVPLEAAGTPLFLDWSELFVPLGAAWTDYTVSLRVRVVEDAGRIDDAFVYVRHREGISNYAASLNVAEDVAGISGDVGRDWRGPLAPLTVLPLADRDWHDLRVDVVGSTVRYTLNGQEIRLLRDEVATRGTLRLLVPPGHIVQFDDVVVVDLMPGFAEVTQETIDFSDGLPADWQTGQLSVDGQRVQPTSPTFAATDSGQALRLGGTTWTFLTRLDEMTQSNYSLAARVMIVQPSESFKDIAFTLRYDAGDGYFGALDLDSSSVSIDADEDGAWQGELVQTSFPLEAGRWYEVRVQAVDNIISLYVDGLRVARALDNNYNAGTSGLTVAPGAIILVDTLQIRVPADEQ